MKAILLVLISITFPVISYGQSLFMQGVETPWVKGEISLIDGSLLKGVIQYNEALSIINFKDSTEAKESRSFLESRILKVIFLGEDNELIKKFYSFPYSIESKENFLLFEVLKEFKTWAVLSRKGPVNVIHSRHELVSGGNAYPLTNTPAPPTKRGYSTVGQDEGIYFIDETGEIKLYLLFKKSESDGIFQLSSTKRKVVGEDLLKEKLATFWPSVSSYAKKNSYSFKNKNDLMRILDYYEDLIKEEELTKD